MLILIVDCPMLNSIHHQLLFLFVSIDLNPFQNASFRVLSETEFDITNRMQSPFKCRESKYFILKMEKFVYETF
jgi:hypothetical protein